MASAYNPPVIHELGGKKIAVVDVHQQALLIWGEWSLAKDEAATLVSIDYHPDTNPPFWLHAYGKAMAIDPEREEELVARFTQGVMAEIDPRDLTTIPMELMRNDEQINTALALGYLSDYHMLNCMERHAYETGHHYLVPQENFGSLSDEMFRAVCFNLEKITGSIILDVDLDYFNRQENLQLDLGRNEIFPRLVQRAEMITVARSETYFDYLKQEAFTLGECEERFLELLGEILV